MSPSHREDTPGTTVTWAMLAFHQLAQLSGSTTEMSVPLSEKQKYPWVQPLIYYSTTDFQATL